MKRYLPTGAQRLKIAVAGLLMLALAACATPFRADVSRFQSQLPAPAGQTFAVVADDPALSGGIEFGQYARLVEANLARIGYQPVADPARADLIVRFDYGVDKGRKRIRSTGFYRDPSGAPGTAMATVAMAIGAASAIAASMVRGFGITAGMTRGSTTRSRATPSTPAAST